VTQPLSGAGEPVGAVLHDPEASVRRGWVASMTLASIGLWAGFFGPIQVLLAEQAAEMVPEHKAAVLGVVTGLGALVSVVANPLFGALSDRTTSRFGRRLPWVAGGAVGGAASLLVLAWAPNVAAMALGWCLAQAALNAMLAALTAAVPDQVPVRQRGVVGGWVGLAQTLGIVAGSGIAAAAGGIAAGYAAIAVALLLLSVPYVLRSHDLRVPPGWVTPITVREFVRRFWISPRRHPDFAWAWVTRFLVNLGNAMGTLYLLFYLKDAVGYPDPAGGVFVLSAVYAACILLTTVVGGRWSDRIGRRTVFVTVSGLVIGLASLILALFPTWPGALTGAVVLGTGFGVYLSVDFALVTEVLPQALDRARDLGVINIAAALPQVVAPAIAAPLVALSGGYVLLYLVSAAICVVGSVLVRQIHGVA
jgi:MFS family permease